MLKFINQYIDNVEKKEKKKSFFIDDLENYIIKKCGGYSAYLDKGGYFTFHNYIKGLEGEKVIAGFKTVKYNGKNPPLKTRWSILQKDISSTWPENEMLRLSDLLDFSFYKKNPDLQTEKVWQYINNIYKFLEDKENRLWSSCEERCLELFNNEKFLDDRESQILKRLNLSYDDLKMKKYGHMFVYWNRGTPNIEKIIILENHSTFFTFKRAAMAGKDIFGFIPDALIYGEGKKIIKSFSFLEEITDINKVKALYFGDIDPEGFMIYRLLREKFRDVNISLLLEAYSALLDLNKFRHSFEGQSENKENINYILDELYRNNMDMERNKIKELFQEKLRIPQEYITYEYLMGL